ncbi:MAG: transcription elongation factor GreB [Alphaproteobacteria bacterium]|nr:transcription elongation factor GreB [Alphaproteobacteria bacterium]
MSKAFVTENDNADADDAQDEQPDVLPASVKNYMTPHGFATLQEELHQLFSEERPKVVEIVSWAAGNGDRSENGDYLYGKKRLREIDRRIRYLMKRLENAEVVDPKKQQGLERIFFGATVTYARASDDSENTVTIVGVDEAEAEGGKISWLSPLAKALMKAQVGDSVTCRTPAGAEQIEIIDIRYILPV